MPATYEPIATTTLGSAAASITFSSIPATYTDLRVVVVAKSDTGSSALKARFNNDTATNYSTTYLSGNGTAASSARITSSSVIYFDGNGGLSATVPHFYTMDVFSYAGSTNKTSLLTINTDDNGSGYVEQTVALWRNTSAINRIDILVTSNNLAIGTTATLYGIKNA